MRVDTEDVRKTLDIIVRTGEKVRDEHRPGVSRNPAFVENLELRDLNAEPYVTAIYGALETSVSDLPGSRIEAHKDGLKNLANDLIGLAATMIIQYELDDAKLVCGEGDDAQTVDVTYDVLFEKVVGAVNLVEGLDAKRDFVRRVRGLVMTDTDGWWVQASPDDAGFGYALLPPFAYGILPHILTSDDLTKAMDYLADPDDGLYNKIGSKPGIDLMSVTDCLGDQARLSLDVFERFLAERTDVPYSTVAREAVETFGVVRVEDRGKKGGDLDGVRAICQSNGSDTQFTVSLMYDSGMSPRHREVFDAMRTQAR